MDSDSPIGSIGVRTILLGLDGSPECESAVALSLRWARRTGARLVGLGIVDEPTIRKPEPVPMGAGYFKHERDERLLEDARRRVKQFLGDLAGRCADEGVSCELIEKVGLPYEQIVLAGQCHDLVVLPRHSHFHFETEHGADDTVGKVLRRSARPVVLVPPALSGSGPVVVAYDGGVHSARALQAFQALGIESGAQVLVVSVHDDGVQAAERAERAVSFLVSHGIPAHRATEAAHGSAATAILRIAHEADARLLVAGMRDRRRLTELLLGSTTQALLRGARIPLFLHG